MISSAAEGALVSFSGCLALTPIVRSLCIRYRILDVPGPLKIHTRSIPRLGGVAVVLSLTAGILVSARDDLRAYSFVLAALGIVWIVELADDLHSISPYARLAAQIASGVLLWLGSWRFLPGNFLPGKGAISCVLLCGAIVVFTNGWNFLDGSDGLASGVAAVISAAWLAISHGFAHDELTPRVAACLAASCAAFLFYNFAPASIHLGDSGSTVLGFCVALLALSRPSATETESSVATAALLISVLPIADFAFAIFRRFRSGASILQGDRFHLYDRVLARGYSARAVALCFYAITAAMGVAAWLSLGVGLLGRLGVWTICVAGILVFAAWLGALPGECEEARLNRRVEFATPKQAKPPP